MFETLHASIPDQNLDMSIASRSSTILQYTLGKTGSCVPIESGDGYDGVNHGCAIINSTITFNGKCSLSTPLENKGRSYNLSFSVSPTSSPGSFFSNSDSTLMPGNGSITNVTFVGDGKGFSLNHSLPINTWSQVSLLGQGNQTFLAVDGTDAMEFTTKIGDGVRLARMAFPAPLAKIGEGSKGKMRDIKLEGTTTG